jgi:rod shape determining protein RodA
MVKTGLRLAKPELSLGNKIVGISWPLVFLILVTSGLGLAILYSVADGAVDTWVRAQSIRLGIGLVLMFAIALVDIRLFLRLAYVGYFAALILLIAVEVAGTIGMGAQRWLEIGGLRIQPSELMKVALVLALARYFHERSMEEVHKVRWLFIPVAMIAAPALLVIRQPDLGTALLLMLGGGVMFILAGVRFRVFAVVAVAVVGAIPFLWRSLHGYQSDRILTFLDPERDPLGAGYHIIQSKIALGAGGVFGRGFREGTQSQLNFLPESQTDFIFTTLAEEFGLVGGLGLLGLYTLMLALSVIIALRSRNHFGRLLALGLGATFFFYVFINIGMVTGLLPVVGVPLPLVSFGGTAMVTLLAGFGLMLSVDIHREVLIPRHLGGISR